MAAYVISEVQIVDEAMFSRYRELAASSIALYGGRYLARGAGAEVVEGEPPIQGRIVIVEFSSLERAHEWYGSPEYAPALKLSKEALKRRLVFVEGLIPTTS